jgi:antagonist of KipI
MKHGANTLEVVKPGVLSTLQDMGRRGQQHLGIVPGGAMDTVAHRLANALVGNPSDEATLEVTLIGPELVLHQDLLVALCGARFAALADGVPVPLDRPVFLTAGTRLQVRQASCGARAYLAVAGGFAVTPVLASRSTYLPASFGGFKGRAIKAGDALPLHPQASALSRERFARLESTRWSAPPMTLPERQPIVVHALHGAHFDWFDAASRQAIFEVAWRVSAESNRIGFRLMGPDLKRERTGDIISGPTCLGTVQVPVAGQPIVLMADHQTTGGYPKILEMASADANALAQLAPGGVVRFSPVTLEEALVLRRRANADLTTKLAAIQARFQVRI